MTLGRDCNVFYDTAGAGDFHFGSAVLQTESGPVDVQVVDDRASGLNGAGSGPVVSGLADGEPAAAFRYDRLIIKIAGAEIGDGHFDGIGAV